MILLLILFLLHLLAIKNFTGGYLQKRQPFSEIANSYSDAYSINPTHRRAVILVIDALRFDFLTPNPPNPPSPFYHNVLTLPRELVKEYPHTTFLYNAYADPPTTTLQRIKAIATGSLPTFVDAGNNLGASSIPDDSILKQAKLAGKRIAFMGDNTWMSVFPDEFTPNMTFPFNGMNVEDLDTVDNGVVEHLFPMLRDETKPFDILVAHFLGMDHVGHRIGADHPRMKKKLEQMNDILRRVVDALDDETLLVVLGDHGMDSLGNHCGDSVLETSSGLWIFSKGPSLMQASPPIHPSLLSYETFPGATIPHRSIQQIDLVPTLSLLLGLPIPYNNLGTVIPEIFWRDPEGRLLEVALEINSQQINRYLKTYRASSVGSDLDPIWDTVQKSWASIRSRADSAGGSRSQLLAAHNRTALAACRKIWARFDFVRMGLGLALLGLGVAACSAHPVNSSKTETRPILRLLCRSGGGVILGFMINSVARRYQIKGLEDINLIPAATLFSFFANLIAKSPPRIIVEGSQTTIFILVAHATTLAIPSLTVWEDRIVALLLHASILPHVTTGLGTQEPHIRSRILRHSFLFAVCVQLMSMSTICREEQQPYCRVTFFGTSTAPPAFALILSIPVAIALPLVIARFLRVPSTEIGRPAMWFLPRILTPSLLGGTGYWILEWADSANILGDAWCPPLRFARTWIARIAFGVGLVGGGALWWKSSASVHVRKLSIDDRRQVNTQECQTTYLCIFLVSFSMAYITSQLTGQLVLALALVALLSYLEVLCIVSEVELSTKPMRGSTTTGLSNAPNFGDILPLPLLGILAFYGTGHQATITSLQLKSAFLLHPTVVYPYSRITLVLNSLGSFFIMALAAPLIVLWKQTQAPRKQPEVDIAPREALSRVGLSIMLYNSILLLGSAVGAAILRDHPLAWKVLAPRYVISAVAMVIVDITVLIGVGVARWITSNR